MIKPKRLLLIYPAMGMSGALVRHLPLSLLYVAIDAIKAGFAIDIVDVRLNPTRWREDIASRISSDTLLVGISVMTGTPVRSALEITRWVKEQNPRLPVVWGGPHVTFCGAEVLAEPNIDFAVCSYGSQPLCRLACHLRGDSEALPLNDIAGLVFRDPLNGVVQAVPPACSFEAVDFRDIPYHLIASDLSQYGQLDTAERIFPLYSSMGCPYQCAFCSSPAQYSNLPKKYECLSPTEVVNHIEAVHKVYGATYIYFIDDDSFVDLSHVTKILDEMERRLICVKLGFRGARVDEILRMDDAFLARLASAGTTILHIGAESGSQRMLDLMKKNITVENIVEVNQKLARHLEITAAYNWLFGLPGETLDDLRLTRQLVLRLIADNPSAIIFAPDKYRPLPGTELYELAVKYGYARPVRLEDWIDVEVEGDYRMPWYSDQTIAMLNMMQVTSYFIDNKLVKLDTGKTFKYWALKIIGRLYSPFARLRYRFGVTLFLFEFYLFNAVVRRMRRA